MTHEDKELLLKDLSARLPYDVMLNISVNKYSDKTFKAIISTIDYCGEIKVRYGFEEYEQVFSIEQIKPYLFPMSSMTDEQYDKFIIVSGWDGDYEDIKRGKLSCVGYIGIDYIYDTIDWLNAHHFDYRGLIERGLAIDATGLNIY